MVQNKRPSYKDVAKILRYEPETGHLYYRVNIPFGAWVKAGQRAGCARKDGRYRVVRIDGKNYEEHQICWLLYYKRWPRKGYTIDHENRIKTQNNIENLREATRSQNQANKDLTKSNKSGYKGVRRASCGIKWIAMIKIDRVMYQLGLFKTKRRALLAYNRATKNAWGEFAVLNKIPPRKVKQKR